MKVGGTFIPGATLFFLSPIVAELLTSSSPPTVFFTPVGILIMSCLYGSGALLARELVLRWNKGWPSLILLGAAYGILEEGLMVRSFFDPRWPGLGAMTGYGRWGGLGWVWALHMTFFHAFFSIVIPIIIVVILFPRARRVPFLRVPGIIVFAFLLCADVTLGGIALNRYVPPLVPFLLTLLVCIACVVLARVVQPALSPPSVTPGTSASTLPGTLTFFFLALGCTILFFLLGWLMPALGVPPVVTAALILVTVAALLVGVRMARRRFGFSSLGLWSLSAGALSFFVILSPLIQLDRHRTNVQGMAFVGLAMALVLVGLLFRARRSSREKS